MNIVEISRVILALVPVIGGAVQQAEQIAIEAQATGKPVTGAQKLQLALGVVKGLYDASSPPVPFEQIVAQVTAIVNEVVAFYNAVQAFKKSAPLQHAA